MPLSTYIIIVFFFAIVNIDIQDIYKIYYETDMFSFRFKQTIVPFHIFFSPAENNNNRNCTFQTFNASKQKKTE